MNPAVYIMASKRNGTLYTGVTSNLVRRAFEHREDLRKGFTRDYGCKLLVWFEQYADMRLAIQREKTIKHWVRRWKLALIEKENPSWIDLFPFINGQGLDPGVGSAARDARTPEDDNGTATTP